jgi:signal recognition particle receptor subunit beta
VIAGGFGVGKTTAVGAISEITPLRTDTAMTSLAATVDSRAQVPDKTTTTVALDFGCITLDETLRLYLFGTPGQDRFGFMWDDIAVGALGALVIVDTRRMNDCYPAVDYFEHIGLPYVVGVNLFHGVAAPDLHQVRWALTIAGDIPVITFDARDRYSVRDALLVVLRHTRSRAISLQDSRN